MTKSIFLTGASGHLGQYVLPQLLEKGYRVFALARDTSQLKVASQNLIICEGYLSDVPQYAELIQSSDGIIHLASTRSALRDTVLQKDTAGLIALMDCWGKGNFIYASSQVVYGKPPSGVTVMDEMTRLAPQGWYDLGKVIGEFIIRTRPYLLREEGRETTPHWQILRIPLLLGNNDRAYDRQFFYPAFRHAAKGDPFVFFRSEQEARSYGSAWLSCKMAAEICIRSLGLNHSTIMNVASGFVYWVPMLETIISQMNSRSKILFYPEQKAIDNAFVLPHTHSRLNTDRMAKLLDIQGEKPFEYYLARALHSFKSDDVSAEASLTHVE